MVDSNLEPSSTLSTINKNSSLTIHTPPDLDHQDHASSRKPRERLESRPTPTSQPSLLSNSRPPSTSSQLPSPLRPTRPSSNNTPPVFWTPSSAEPPSITPSPLLDTELKVDKSTTSSETH